MHERDRSAVHRLSRDVADARTGSRSSQAPGKLWIRLLQFEAVVAVAAAFRDEVGYEPPVSTPVMFDSGVRDATDVVIAPSEPYPFAERHRPELEAVAADVRFIDGRDLLWWGARTPGALQRDRPPLRVRTVVRRCGEFDPLLEVVPGRIRSVPGRLRFQGHRRPERGRLRTGLALALLVEQLPHNASQKRDAHDEDQGRPVVQAALLGKPRPTKPVNSISLEVKRTHVIEH